MVHGLLWLPLLALFIWLAWSGWNEYQKVEAYRIWADPFERSKYDIYSVLGQKENNLTWGIPTRQGPTNLKTFSLEAVETIQLRVDGRLTDQEAAPEKGKAVLEFVCANQTEPIRIPFTEPPLAAKWERFLQQELQRLQSELP
ncbi:MAG: hypothetical protein WCA35_13575 [Kovacikia sp.]